jgi:hypothetical protein
MLAIFELQMQIKRVEALTNKIILAITFEFAMVVRQ